MNKVTIRLSNEDMELVRRLGGGKLTDGVRRALAMARDIDAAIARIEARLPQGQPGTETIQQHLQRLEAKINGVGKLTQSILAAVEKEAEHA